MNTEQTLEEMASNVLKIKNNTRQKQELSINISIPEGWQLFSKTGATFTINPSDSAFIPVRIIPSKSSKGSTNYIINAFLTSSNGFQLANDYWYVNIRRISNWSVNVLQQKVYFINGAETSSFDVLIENSGNSDETIRLDFFTQKNLVVVDSSGNPTPLSRTIRLSAGADSLFTGYVKKTDEQEKGAITVRDGNDWRTNYTLKLSAKNDAGSGGVEKLWRGNIDFYELNNALRAEGHGYSFLPIAFDINTYDILDNTTLSLDIYGTAQFNKDRSLTYRYQTNYTDNFVDAAAYIGSYHYLGFFSRRGSLETGNLSMGKFGSFVGGKGAKGALFTRKNQLSGMFVVNPEFRDFSQTGLALNNTFRVTKFISDSYFQRKWDELSKVNSTFLGTSSTYQITRRHIVKTTLGISHQHHYAIANNPLNLVGFGYELSYTGGVKKVSYGVSHRYGNKKHTTFNGVFSFASTLGYAINERYSLSFLFDYYESNPEAHSGGVQLPTPPSVSRQRYEMKLSMATKTSKLVLRSYYLHQDILLLRTATKAVGLDYRPSSEGSLRFYMSAEGGFVKAYNTGLSDFFFLRLFGNLKYKALSASLRYFYGPYEAIEQIRFIQIRQNTQKLVASSYYDFWLVKSKLNFKTNATFNYDTYFKRIGLILRPELFYYAGGGFTFSAYAEYILSSQTARSNAARSDVAGGRDVTNDFNIGAGIKKTFNIPPNRKKFHDVEFTVFKDQNGNGLMDEREDPVENILVGIKGSESEAASNDSIVSYKKPVDYELLTGKDGTVVFENLPTGSYDVLIYPLVETGGWFEEKKRTHLIDGKKRIGIPLIRAARVSGSIVLEMDKYSRYEEAVDLSRIRITAINSAGNTYSTLTGKNGEFSMFLPVGEYSISVNKSALGETFEFVKSEVKISMNNPNSSYNTTFYVRERKRVMNIKEFKD